MIRTRLNPGETGTFFLDNEEEITIIAIEDDMENVPRGGYCSNCILRDRRVCMTVACSAKEDRVGVHFIKSKKMKRTEFRVIIDIDRIAYEGMGSMEWVPGLGIVSYLDDEERIKQCQILGPYYCPITEEIGILDLDWRKQYEEHKDDAAIIPTITETYVVKDNTIIAKFYAYDSEGIVFDRKKAIEYAEQFVKAISQTFKLCPNCDGKNEEVNECCRYCGWTF